MIEEPCCFGEAWYGDACIIVEEVCSLGERETYTPSFGDAKTTDEHAAAGISEAKTLIDCSDGEQIE